VNVELHLPDLPDVPVALGPVRGGARRQRPAWSERLRGLLGTTLPLMLMALLALGTWWLIRHAPEAASPQAPRSAQHVPDYRLERFTLQRFAASGERTLQIEGQSLRHFPDNDELDIDSVTVVATGVQGRDTHATARQAIASGDGSRVQLMGGVEVLSSDNSGQTVVMTGEHLDLQLSEQVLLADKPVRVRQGDSEFRADGLRLDQTTQQLTLIGPVRAVFQPGFTRR
jgi:lipopolysaccharide export system protein LptC